MAIGDGCAVTAPRLEVVDAAGLAEVRVLAGAGTLRIAGEPARGDVRIEGTACAPRERDLERLEVVVTRTGGSLLIEAPPEGPSQGRIDLVIAMPAELPVGVTDGSGSLEIRGVAAVGLDDGSGGVAISDIAGDVREVGGDVVIGQDGSGGIDVADVGGDLTVGADGSGGVEWRRVAGRVQAARD
jgi:hypothetical protein